MEGEYWVGIRREDKSVWERRTPLSPIHVGEILLQHKNIHIIVQPSKKRIFSDMQYEKVGAIISEDLSPCSLILGIKEIPAEKLIPNKTFIYFSHTIKGQLHNMLALDSILQNNIRLIDYEKIEDENGNRLIAFGKYAGIAGAIDFLKGFGEYIMQMGINTPFLHANCAYKYFNIEECYAHLKLIGQKIVEKEIPQQLCPMIFAVTGRGRTAQGVLEVIENLPITKIKPNDIAKLMEDKDNAQHRTTIYVVNINTEDCMVPRDPQASYDKTDFTKNPSKYKNIFKTKYLPYISALFHCIFWEPRFPKYIKNHHLSNLAENNNLRLIGICDVTCDLDGSIECLTEYTNPESPFFYYDSIEQTANFKPQYKYGKIIYLAIDFLPCELAFDASIHFSKHLKDWVENLVKSHKDKQLDEQQLKPELKKAVIAYNNKLAKNFEYIVKLREENLQRSLANILAKKKQILRVELDKLNPFLATNVVVVPAEQIKGQKLDFTN